VSAWSDSRASAHRGLDARLALVPNVNLTGLASP
jgi:hypothetical protein